MGKERKQCYQFSFLKKNYRRNGTRLIISPFLPDDNYFSFLLSLFFLPFFSTPRTKRKKSCEKAKRNEKNKRKKIIIKRKKIEDRRKEGKKDGKEEKSVKNISSNIVGNQQPSKVILVRYFHLCMHIQYRHAFYLSNGNTREKSTYIYRDEENAFAFK